MHCALSLLLAPAALAYQAAPAAVEPAATTPKLAPEDKLHPLFKAPAPGVPPKAPAWADLGKNDRGDPITAAIVLFHADEPLGAHAANLITRHNGVLRTEFLTTRGVFAEIPTSSIAALAAEDAVMWIEPPIPALEPLNADARARMHVDAVQTAPYNLTGRGVDVLVFDGGRIRSTHRDLIGRVAPIDQAPVEHHATHVAGTIAGDGTASAGEHRGMATEAYLYSAGFQSASGIPLHTNPGDIELDYAAAHLAKRPGTLISNNSLGANISFNGFDCALLGDYGTTSAFLDDFIIGALGEPMIIAWAAGNERSSGACPGPYGTISPPASAKNPIIVGAINSNDDSMTTFSSFGPTDDGRIAPTIVAPGCQVGDDDGITSTTHASDSGYRVSCGTSMATPAVTGVLALLMEDWRAQYPSRPDPSNATLKMILAHSAADLGNTGPDYMHGYGSVRADAAVDFLRAGNIATASLNHAQSTTLLLDVPPGAPSLKLTLAWDDAPATPGAPIALVNDLDLRITDPLGARHYPWTLNPADPQAPATRTTEDHLNNIEQVFVDAPVSGIWTVEVVATNVPIGPQPFSLGSSINLDLPDIQIALPDDLPQAIAPAVAGNPTEIPVRITATNDTIDSASAIVAWREAGSTTPFTTAPLVHISGDDYSATIPTAACGPDIELFFAASGLSGARATNPPQAPNLDGTGPTGFGHTHTARIGHYEIRFYDNFDTDTGWTVENTAVSDGAWTRGVPVGGGLRGDPATDADGGVGEGGCWLTDNEAGNSDLDGGPTILNSPTLDASGNGGGSGGEARVSYWRWYNTAVGAAPLEDPFYVEVSSDNGQTWTLLEEVAPGGADGSGGWRFAQFDLAPVTPLTSTMRFRFIAEDIGTASIIEAAVDTFTLEVFHCGDPVPPCICDTVDDNTIDVFDLLAYLDLWFTADPAADLDTDPAINVFDLLTYLDCWFTTCD